MINKKHNKVRTSNLLFLYTITLIASCMCTNTERITLEKTVIINDSRYHTDGFKGLFFFINIDNYKDDSLGIYFNEANVINQCYVTSNTDTFSTESILEFIEIPSREKATLIFRSHYSKTLYNTLEQDTVDYPKDNNLYFNLLFEQKLYRFRIDKSKISFSNTSSNEILSDYFKNLQNINFAKGIVRMISPGHLDRNTIHFELPK